MDLNQVISVVTPCFNEEDNVRSVYEQVKAVFSGLPSYPYEHIFIDNASSDKTVPILKEIIGQDPRVRLIVNIRNFGHIRSPFHGMLQAKGAAVITLMCDLEDPPGLIKDFIKKWEDGYKIVIAVKSNSNENRPLLLIRRLFYFIIGHISESEQIKNFSGYGLYDRQFVDILRHLDEPYPYFRGLISEFGSQWTEIHYQQQKRERGRSKNNFYTLYDTAMLGFVNHSKLPLRLASFLGFSVATLSFAVALVYFIYKVLYWDQFQVGISPLVIGVFFFSGVQLFFLGIIGEYIGAIFTQVKKRPLVIEKERINF